MRFLIGSLTLLFIITSCREDKKMEDQQANKITITPFYQDSVSVRAILPLDENRVWFGGNLGKVGLINHDTPKLATITYQDSLLQFRAIAGTKDAVFVLSIANPAILYKIGFDGIQATAIEQVYFEQHEKVFYDAIRFWDEMDGIAVGDPIEDCLSILITRDGGNNWTKIPCEQLPKTVEGEAAYAASNSNVAIVNDKVWIVSGGAKSRVFYSGDKGNTWEVFNTPIIEGGKMTGIYSVDFYDENTGVIFGGDWENKDNNTGNKAIT